MSLIEARIAGNSELLPRFSTKSAGYFSHLSWRPYCAKVSLLQTQGIHAMQVSKKEGRMLDKAIENWLESEIICESDSQKLKASYAVTSLDWQRFAKYSFWLAMLCILITILIIILDEWLVIFFKELFNASDAVKCIVFALVSGGLYVLAIRRKLKHLAKVYSNEAIFFLGVVTTAISIGFLGNAIDTWSAHFSLLLLLAAIIYGVIGLWFHSTLVWLCSLLALGIWFGAETGYISDWDDYYFGMNYPLRFVLFGLALVWCGSYLFSQWQSRSALLRPTRAVGLLYLFVALWMMSIFGNHSDLEIWLYLKQIELLQWTMLLAITSAGAIYHGVKYDDRMTRGFGLIFIFINLYSRFFEYFWDGTHKAIFFALLAVSFWYLGTKAEKIWQLNLVKNLINQSSQK